MSGLAVPVAVSYDQASVAALHARGSATDIEAAVSGLRVADHDPRTIGEAAAVLEAVLAAARRSEEAMRATAFAADLASRMPPVGVDPELERMQMIVSFHESGHAVYADQSRIMTPASAEIDVDRGLFGGMHYCGVVMVLFTKDPRRWAERDFIDDAACSLAGTAAEAYWCQRVEGSNYDAVKQQAYATHSGVDYAYACDCVGTGTREFQKAERLAYRVVAERWENIIAMAEILRDKERMSAGQIRRAA